MYEYIQIWLCPKHQLYLLSYNAQCKSTPTFFRNAIRIVCVLDGIIYAIEVTRKTKEIVHVCDVAVVECNGDTICCDCLKLQLWNQLKLLKQYCVTLIAALKIDN